MLIYNRLTLTFLDEISVSILYFNFNFLIISEFKNIITYFKMSVLD